MLGVDFVGIELDEAYLNEAIERTQMALSGGRSKRRPRPSRRLGQRRLI
jgi:hypothetical protein